MKLSDVIYNICWGGLIFFSGCLVAIWLILMFMLILGGFQYIFR